MRKALLFICCVFLFSQLSGQDIFSSKTVVKDIYLTFYDGNWEEALLQNKLSGEEERILAKIQLNGITYDSVGVRYKGNSSFFNVKKTGAKKFPFNIKIDHIVKKQSLPNGYESLKLSNVFRDPSFVREVLAYDIASNYMPSPRAAYVRLHINGAPFGLYNITESIDKAFLKRHFGYKKGTLVKCDPNWKATANETCPKGDKASLNYLGDDPICYEGLYELKSNKGWENLISLSKTLNKDIDKIENILNVDQVLWMHAFNNVLVNLDSYAGRLCHNYYLFQDSFGVFQPILWDMNLSFGGFRFSGESNKALTVDEMQNMSMFLHFKTSNSNRPLITNLLKNSRYRKIYVAHLKTILRDYFANGKYKEQAGKYQNAIDYYVQNDENKLYSYETFKQNLNSTVEAGKSKIVGLTELMDSRSTYLLEHPLLKRTSLNFENIKAEQKDSSSMFSVKVLDAKKVWLRYRSKSGERFKEIEMQDDGLNEDLTPGDYVFGVVLNNQVVLDYYLIAEDDKTASLSPEKAAFEFHTLRTNTSINE